jgi:hypothetical protein
VLRFINPVRIGCFPGKFVVIREIEEDREFMKAN